MPLSSSFIIVLCYDIPFEQKYAGIESDWIWQLTKGKGCRLTYWLLEYFPDFRQLGIKAILCVALMDIQLKCSQNDNKYMSVVKIITDSFRKLQSPKVQGLQWDVTQECEYRENNVVVVVYIFGLYYLLIMGHSRDKHGHLEVTLIQLHP